MRFVRLWVRSVSHELIGPHDHGHKHGGLPVVWILGGIAAIVVLALIAKSAGGGSSAQGGSSAPADVQPGQLQAYQLGLQYAAAANSQNAETARTIIQTAASYESDRQKIGIARQTEADNFSLGMRGLDIQEEKVQGDIANTHYQYQTQLEASLAQTDAQKQVGLASVSANLQIGMAQVGVDQFRAQTERDLGNKSLDYNYKLGNKKLDNDFKLGDKSLDYGHEEKMTGIGYTHEENMTKIGNDFTLGKTALDYGFSLGNKQLDNDFKLGDKKLDYGHEETMDKQNKDFWGGLVSPVLNFLGGLFGL